MIARGLYRTVSTLIIMVCVLYMCLVSMLHFDLQVRDWQIRDRNDIQQVSNEDQHLQLHKRTQGEQQSSADQSLEDKYSVSRTMLETHHRKHPRKSSSSGTNTSGIETNTYKTGTYTSKTGTSKTGTDTSKTGTGTSKTGTDTSNTGTDTSNTGTDTSYTGTDTSKTSTDHSNTGTSKTGTDTSKTGTDTFRFDNPTFEEHPSGNNQQLTMRKLRENTSHHATNPSQEDTPPPASSTNINITEIKVNFAFLRGCYIYGIFLDKRYPKGEFIRFLIIQPTRSPTPQLMCQFRDIRNIGINVTVEPYEMCENHGRKYGGWIYSCPVPRLTGGATLQTVSLLAVTEDLIVLDSLKPVTLQSLSVLDKRDLRSPQSKYPRNKNNQTSMKFDNISQASVTNPHENISQASVSNPHENISQAFVTNPHENISQAFVTNPHENISQAFVTNPQQASMKFDNISQASVTNPQQASYFRDKKIPKLGVCVPPLHGDISLSKIINFIEMCRLLGADKVFLYIHDIPTDFLAFLKNYTGPSSRILRLVLWDLPIVGKNAQPTEANQIIWNRGQLPAIQHCLYTNMPQFDWLLFIDIDEMLIPQKSTTWPELLSEVTSQSTFQFQGRPFAGISFESAFFQQDFQTQATNSIDYFQYLHRTTETSLQRSKLFVQPFQVFELGIHHLSRGLLKDMAVIRAGVQQALLHHYRKCVPEYNTASTLHCEILVKDDTILRYEAPMTAASREVITGAMEFLAGYS